jgi:hypothetical protein
MMKNISIQKCWIAFLIMMFVTIWMSSCSTLPFQSSEDALRKRVEEMMNARIDDDWEKIYGYLDPAYRSKVSKKNFLNIKRDMDYTKYSISSIEIQSSGIEAIVQVKQDINVNVFNFKDKAETQHWVKDGFSWYLKVNDLKFNH